MDTLNSVDALAKVYTAMTSSGEFADLSMDNDHKSGEIIFADADDYNENSEDAKYFVLRVEESNWKVT